MSIKFKFYDVDLAFEFVNATGFINNFAYFNIKTGK